MSENTDTVTQPNAFVRVARKVVDRGNFKEASISIPVAVDPTNVDGEFWKQVDDVTTAANAALLDALGVEYNLDPESGKIVEVIPEPPVAAAVTNVNASFGGGDVPQCPKCGSDMYDNRATKKNPRQPDFKCKAYKDGCDGAVWPPR
jgi:hypothetical protein